MVLRQSNRLDAQGMTTEFHLMVPPGYRLLKPEETIQHGDLWFNSFMERFVKVKQDKNIGRTVKETIFIAVCRKVTP
jgi:hypothetical protein